MSRFVIVNGKVVEKEEINLSHLFWEDRLEISQKCWFGFGGIPLLEENLKLLLQQMKAVKIPVPTFFQNKRELFRVTKRMLNKNKFYRSGFIHLQVFEHNNQVTSLVTSHAFETFDFPLSENGLIVNYSEFKKETQSPLNQFRFFNIPLWNTARADIIDTFFQNSIFLNKNGTICDCINANIFFIIKNEIITPAPTTGCFIDNLRSIILEISSDLNLKVVESENIYKEDVLQMNEIFIAGEEYGIQWLLGVENKRYVHRYSAIIHEKLNDYLKKKVV
jgi:branched-chain amino acid aminotransferase